MAPNAGRPRRWRGGEAARTITKTDPPNQNRLGRARSRRRLRSPLQAPGQSIHPTAALWAGTQVRGIIATIVASLIMGVAVTGMHYTAMAAMEMSPGSMPSMGGSTAGSFLFPLVFGISLVTVILTLAISLSPTEDEIKAEALLKRRFESRFRADLRRAATSPPTAPAVSQPVAPPQAMVPANRTASAKRAAAHAGPLRPLPRRRPLA